MPLHVRRLGDTFVPIRAKLIRKGSTTPVDLTGLDVKFKMVASDGSDKVEAIAATVVSAVNGTVEYDFTSYDVDVAGDFFGYFFIDNAGGTDYFPVESGNLIVRFSQDVPAS